MGRVSTALIPALALSCVAFMTVDAGAQNPGGSPDGKKMKNAAMTVKLNGVLVQENVEVPHTTTAAGRAEGPEPGPIQLQNHGTPVFYRNIWIMEK